ARSRAMDIACAESRNGYCLRGSAQSSSKTVLLLLFSDFLSFFPSFLLQSLPIFYAPTGPQVDSKPKGQKSSNGQSA
ncbi:hypothetical protein, partial [Thalassococcus profundi]|uniref:hypothetical protein n=1 Tax=Thalassococcus profundi TaxID=2282382 RepID=UPI001F3BE177